MFHKGLFQNRILEVSVGLGTVVIASLVTLHIFRKPRRKITRIIDTMDVLNNKSVHIKDRDRVEDIVSQLIKGSASKLQVIADFDHTLSRVHKNGHRCPTTYGILKTSALVNEDYKCKGNQLFSHYHAIEVDSSLTKEEKIPHMLEWYNKSLGLMSTSGITKETLPGILDSSEICLRDGCDALIETLYKHNVPLLVFSAGIGDVLTHALRRCNLFYPNVKIIANLMRFDEKNKLSGYKEDLIHTYNKSQKSIENSSYFNHLEERKNVILLGDSLGDLDMAAGVKDMSAILKIGFLNFNIESSLAQYMDSFDIVLVDDQTMDVVAGLLQSIL